MRGIGPQRCSELLADAGIKVSIDPERDLDHGVFISLKEPEDTITITNEGAMEFDSAPGLSFTKPLSASVGGKRILNPRWSSILISMITEVMTKGYEGKKLVSQLQVPARAERYEDDGFKYYPDLGISVQGQSASDAWKEIDRLANAFGVRVKVEFWWRRNPKAQFPGKTGILTAGKA